MLNLDKFYDAVVGKIEYDSADHSIAQIEEFLMYWLNGLDYENSKEIIENIYYLFKNDFIYQGVLYRGIALNKGVELKSDYLTSFTNDMDVAEEFANTYGKETQESLIFKIEGKAFDFSEFLNVIREKSSNFDLDIVIEERNWEMEKLCVFNIDEAELINR